MTSRRLPQAAVALLLRQMAGALHAGYTPIEAVDLLNRSSSAASKCAELMAALVAVSSNRSSWVEALEPFSVDLPREVADLLAHGERSGQLAATLELVAQEFEQRAGLRDSLRGALAWPLMIIVVFLVVTSVVMVYVVPAFRETFSSFGADLPAPTLFFIELSVFFVSWWWLILGVALAIGLAYRQRVRLIRDWSAWSSRILRSPVIGAYLSAAFLLRTGRLLQPVAAGRLAAAPVLAYLRASTRVSALASQSQALAEALDSGQSLPDAVRRALPWGGDLAVALETDLRRPGSGSALQRTLDLAEDDFLRKRVRLEQTMVGAVYLLTGVFVGSFVIAMYLPIFKLGSVV